MRKNLLIPKISSKRCPLNYLNLVLQFNLSCVRTEREIERRLDDNDFRKKYFLFQKLPSYLFEVVFCNERQLKCRSLMLVSEKLVSNLGSTDARLGDNRLQSR